MELRPHNRQGLILLLTLVKMQSLLFESGLKIRELNCTNTKLASCNGTNLAGITLLL